MKSKSHRLGRCFEALVLSLAVLGAACAGTGNEEPVTAAAAQAEPAPSEPAQAEAPPPAPRASDEKAAMILRQVQRTPAETERKAAERLAADEHLMAPPDGEWLVDEESGREYFLVRLPKSEPWSWEDEEHTEIRYRNFEVWQVEREEEDHFEVRMYRLADQPPTPVGYLDPEEAAAIAATYRSETGESDVLELVSFGHGLPDHGQWRNGFGIADMNGDGHLDIVHAPPRGSGILPVVLLGDGSGSWKVWEAARFPRLAYSYGDAAAADLDGDGHQDLVLAMHLNGLVALRNDGQGTFSPWGEGLDYWEPSSNELPGFSSRALEVVDWNGDGRPDILALGEGPRPRTGGGTGAPQLIEGSFGVALYLNQGDGTWQRVLRDEETNLFGDAIVVGDFNGDGRTDFATSSSTIGLRRLVHYGEEDGSWRSTEVGEARRRAFVRGVAAGDLDGDGRDDLALTYTSREGGAWRSGIDLLYAGPEETWQRVVLHAVEDRSGYYAVDVGDLDGDGRLEVVALDEEGGHLIFTQLGDRRWAREASPETAPLEQGCRGYHVELVDLDGDGRDEIVEEFAGEPEPFLAPDDCRRRGGMLAWDAAPKPTPPGY